MIPNSDMYPQPNKGSALTVNLMAETWKKKVCLQRHLQGQQI